MAEIHEYPMPIIEQSEEDCGHLINIKWRASDGRECAVCFVAGSNEASFTWASEWSVGAKHYHAQSGIEFDLSQGLPAPAMLRLIELFGPPPTL